MRIKIMGLVILALALLWGCVKFFATDHSAYEDGIRCLQKGDNRQAVIEFTRVLSSTPDNIGALCNRASAYDGLNDFPHAEQDLAEAIRLATHSFATNPMNSELYYNRGVLYARYGHFHDAIADYREAIHLRPQIEDARNNLASLLATHPGATREEGIEAVQLATKACDETQWKDEGCLDTLASAYARAGEFEKAVIWQQKAMKLTSDTDRLKEYQDRLAYYKIGKPYTDTLPKPEKLQPGKLISGQ